MTKKDFDDQMEKLFLDEESEDIFSEKKTAGVLKLLEEYIGNDRIKLLALKAEWEEKGNPSWFDSIVNSLSLVVSGMAFVIALLTFLFDCNNCPDNWEVFTRLIIVLVFILILLVTIFLFNNRIKKIAVNRCRHYVKMTALQEYEKMYTETIE